MALTTITRPIGRRYSAVSKTAAVDNNFNYARFTSTAHGLTTGDFILIENSPVPAYNGIWYADVNDVNEYFIRPSSSVDYVSWVNDATVQVRAEDLEHMWSAVHLPIVYEVTNDLYPYTAGGGSIVSIDNDNGYARIRMSTSMTIYPLEFVIITGAASPELNGIFQVQAVTTLNRVTIDLAYKGTYNQSGALIRHYYSNYALIVRVYAGITNTPGAYKKPMELAATLKYIPDNNNTIRFSISEVLQSYVKLRNGVGDDIMPNNIDFFTEFYVTYQETYDYSFGYTLLRFEGSITSDTPDYVGKAVNSKLQFGNPYSGYLSEYLMNIQTAKFLTLFSIPTLFSCEDTDTPCYQDISFITPGGGGVIQREYYKDGAVQATTQNNIAEKGKGVYRVPLQEPGVNTCFYDSMRVTLIDGTPQAPFALSLGDQVDPPEGNGGAWVDGSPTYDFENFVTGVSYVTEIIYDEVNIDSGTYTFSYRLTKNQAGTPVTFWIVALNDELEVISKQEIITFSDAATHINTQDFTLPAAKYVGVYTTTPLTNLPTPVVSVYITDFFLDDDIYPRVSESKMVKIDCGCSNQEIKLTWVNNLGGWEYWTFTAEKDYMTEVVNTQTSEKNVLPTWPQSYGHTADTLRYETMRTSRRNIVVRSQNGLTEDEAFALSYIKSSPLVQMIDAAGRRTVTVDTNSMQITTDNQKLREIEFTITETGDIPAQTA